MMHFRTISPGGPRRPRCARRRGAADGPVIITFDKVETGKPMASYTDQGVVFALSHPPTKSHATGRVMFFPHLKTPRKGILNAMANESIPVEVRFPEAGGERHPRALGFDRQQGGRRGVRQGRQSPGPGVEGQGAGADRSGAADPEFRADGEGIGDRVRPLFGCAAGRLPGLRRGALHADGRRGERSGGTRLRVRDAAPRRQWAIPHRYGGHVPAARQPGAGGDGRGAVRLPHRRERVQARCPSTRSRAGSTSPRRTRSSSSPDTTT